MTATETPSTKALIDEAVVARVLREALATGGEFAEVFAEDRRGSVVALDDGRIEDISSGRERGAGIRVVVGNTTGFAHTADLSERGLLAAAEVAAGAARGGGGGVREVALSRSAPISPSPVEVLPSSVGKADKVDLLRRADAAARSAGGAVRQVNANYRDSRRQVLVANSEGVFASDDQVRVRFGTNVVANGDTGMQTGGEAVGLTMGFEMFNRYDVEDLARSAADRALLKLKARPAPSGTMPVVIQAGSGGVLFHEACGHGLEADHIAKAVSVFTGRVGEEVASPLVTLVDDGTMSHEWGALAIDDEGHPTSRNVLIENGVLTDYMWDWMRAKKEGRPTPSNGRRQSYQHLPMVRMTNTFLMNGEESPEEIIRQTPHGVYVAKLGGGQVNTATGDFVFGMTEAYLIEDGQLTEPIRDANLIGNGPQALLDIDVIGNDFAMGWPGTCGKQGQGVPVGVGQPTLRVRALTIGGTAALSELLDLAVRVAGWSRDGEAVEVYLSRGTETEVAVYDGEIESLSSATSAGAGIRVVSGGRQGFAYAGSLDEDVIAETLQEARDNASFSSAEPWVGLPQPDGSTPVALDLWRDELATCPTDRKVSAALELEREVRAGDPRIRQVETVNWGDSSSEMALASSLGISATDRSTACYLAAIAVAGEGVDSQVAYGYTVGRAPSELVPSKASEDAVSRAVRLLGATKPRSAHLPVVFEPRVTAQLLGLLGSVLSGEMVLKGVSLFADRLGEPVAAAGVTLVDDPTEPAAWGSASFDDEGLACRRNTLIEQGVLRRFLYDSTSARRAGTSSTASAVRAGYKSAPGVGTRAIYLLPGELSVAEVLSKIGDGLLVQSVSGLHSGVNPVSGDFSVGAEGLLFHDGELGAPVREATIASSIQRMLLGVDAIGNDLEWLPAQAAGVTLAIGEMSLSGI